MCQFDAAKLKTMNSSVDIGALFNMLSQVARDVKELKEENRNAELELAKECITALTRCRASSISLVLILEEDSLKR